MNYYWLRSRDPIGGGGNHSANFNISVKIKIKQNFESYTIKASVHTDRYTSIQ